MLVQNQSHTLRHLTSAHLAQTMTLLGLSTSELRQKIEAELARNPALELLEARRCPTCGRALPDSLLAQSPSPLPAEISRRSSSTVGNRQSPPSPAQ